MTENTNINDCIEDFEYQNEMVRALTRRLRALELDKARGNVEPKILTEIEDLQQKIQQHREQIEALQKCTNLIYQSVHVEIFRPGRSSCTINRASDKLEFDFHNGGNDPDWWSGVALQFTPALNVRGFTHLQVSGAATEPFKFNIEYKVREGSNLQIKTKFEWQPFPATGQVSTIPVPIKYDGAVDEIALMFYVKGDASHVTIESIRLSK